jgi:hypothetical protein
MKFENKQLIEIIGMLAVVLSLLFMESRGEILSVAVAERMVTP